MNQTEQAIADYNDLMSAMTMSLNYNPDLAISAAMQGSITAGMKANSPLFSSTTTMGIWSTGEGSLGLDVILGKISAEISSSVTKGKGDGMLNVDYGINTSGNLTSVSTTSFSIFTNTLDIENKGFSVGLNVGDYSFSSGYSFEKGFMNSFSGTSNGRTSSATMYFQPNYKNLAIAIGSIIIVTQPELIPAIAPALFTK